MKVIFLGTNGWFDDRDSSTPCVLIKTEERNILLDAGFGLAKADGYLDRKKPTVLFLSHLHLDHIVGLHTLPKLGLKELEIILPLGTKKQLETILCHPYTADPGDFGMELKMTEVEEGRHEFPLPFECHKLRHVDQTFGYRLEIEGKVIVYVSDTAPCENGRELAREADLLIHECASQKEDNFSWGHAGPAGAARIAQEATAKKLALIHFNPVVSIGEQGRKKAAKAAEKIFPEVVAASDGMEIEV